MTFKTRNYLGSCQFISIPVISWNVFSL